MQKIIENKIASKGLIIAFTILLLSAITLIGCNSKPDELFYKKADILDIKRDDDSQFHLLVRYEDGTVESVADAGCKIKMGKYSPFAEMPFVKWDNGNKKGTIKAWGLNSTDYRIIDIKVYLPLDYKIELVDD